MLRSVKSLLKEKGVEVWWVSPRASVFDALKIMADRNIGAVVVRDGGDVVGIFSERDYARHGRCTNETTVAELMSKNVTCVGPELTVGKCMALMTGKHIRHLPVVEGGKLVGVISIGDVVKQAIAGQGLLIDQLEKYITGTAAA